MVASPQGSRLSSSHRAGSARLAVPSVDDMQSKAPLVTTMSPSYTLFSLVCIWNFGALFSLTAASPSVISGPLKNAACNWASASAPDSSFSQGTASRSSFNVAATAAGDAAAACNPSQQQQQNQQNMYQLHIP